MELRKKREAQSDLWQWTKRKEVYWVQQSRILWLKVGHLNTKFFHMVASNRKRRNGIASIKINGSTIPDHVEIKSCAKNFFKSIFHEDFQVRPIFDGLHFDQLT